MRNTYHYSMIPLTTPLFPNASYQPIQFANMNNNNEMKNTNQTEYQIIIHYENDQNNSSFQN